MTVRRYGLRDDQWERISELLPGRKGQVGRPAQDNRRFVEAVLYRYRAGIAWRDLPPRLGDWKNTRKLPRQADNALLESATVVSLGIKRRGGSPPRAS